MGNTAGTEPQGRALPEFTEYAAREYAPSPLEFSKPDFSAVPSSRTVLIDRPQRERCSGADVSSVGVIIQRVEVS